MVETFGRHKKNVKKMNRKIEKLSFLLLVLERVSCL